MAFRPSRWWARASRPSSRSATANPFWSRLPELNFIDDKEGKAGRHQLAHRPPSDRRLRQLGRRFPDARVDHRRRRAPAWEFSSTTPTSEREWAYDRESHIGRLDRGLDEADARGWIVVSMKDDWRRIFP